MDQFIVSARKYRPITFDNVVGQSHIAETLKNAIKSGHLAQAFLFSGPRGVGKTTCARILAKTINCFNRSDKIEACEKCESCKSFNEGHSLNVYELDAASNNSVEDIRSLIEQVRFAPQLGSKKVYIIDEVHMLSTSAFNAFLKTLEEPPSHAIFILATTEKHKIIPTILSRCQIFDFNRIDLDDMVRQLAEISVKEGVKSDNDALHLIANKSDGSLRDALSMFDQMVTYSGSDLSYQAVVENLSILNTDYFFALVNHLVTRNIPAALNLFDEILHKGFDGHHFLLGLAEHMRNLLVSQDHSTIDLLSAGPQLKQKYASQTLTVSGPFLLKALNLISQADMTYKAAKNQRLLVELCLLNLANLQTEKKAEELSNTLPTEAPEVKKKPIESVKTEEAPPIEPQKPPAPEVQQPKEEIKSAESIEAIETKEESTSNTAEESTTVEAESPSQTKTEEIINVEPEAAIPTSNKPEEIKEDFDSSEPEVVGKKEEVVEPVAEVKAEEKKIDEAPAKSEEKPKKPSLQDMMVNDSISISSFTNKNSDEKEAIEGEDVRKEIRFEEEITKEKLADKWDNMTKMYEEKGRFNLFTTLKKYEPALVDETHIEITYDNKAQAQAINLEKTNILEYLRRELRNDLLQLKLTISDHVHQRAYTASEKLEKMIEKNPNIDLLKNKLDLDIN